MNCGNFLQNVDERHIYTGIITRNEFCKPVFK